MKKVVFFTLGRWAFGSIHYGLTKELYKHGIYSNVLDWTQQYSKEEIKLIDKSYDIWLTNPEAVNHLHFQFGIPYEKIKSVAHGQWDMLLARETSTNDIYNKISGFGVVSDILKNKAKEFGINVVPDVLELGIHFDQFYRPVPNSLKNIGYAGAREVKNYFGTEIKRGRLVNETIQSIPYLNLIEHNFYHWIGMPAYYESIDALIVSSSEEAAGLPALEAAAAGRMVFSTPVGYFEKNGGKGGYVLPVEENSFKDNLKNYLINFYHNPELFNIKCKEFQEYAKGYDWSCKIESWINFLLK